MRLEPLSEEYHQKILLVSNCKPNSFFAKLRQPKAPDRSRAPMGSLTQTGRVRTFLLLAPREGLEPSTYWLTASRSNQLSYLGM